jgi:hypothetical protein
MPLAPFPHLRPPHASTAVSATLGQAARAARLRLLRMHMELDVAVSDREFGSLLSTRVCIVQGFAPNASMPLLDPSGSRKCVSMTIGEHGFREGLAEESVRVDCLLEGEDRPASMWTGSEDGPTPAQQKAMEEVRAWPHRRLVIHDHCHHAHRGHDWWVARRWQSCLVLECSFEVVIVLGDPAKKAFLRVLEKRGGGRHVGTAKYDFGKESRAIEWGGTTNFTQRHPQNLLPSWSGAQVARA